MRKHIGIVLTVTVLSAAGFAGASIVNGGSLAAVLTGSGTTATTGSVSTSTGTGPQRKVTLCHRTGSKKHPGHTIVVAQSAVKAHLRHGDTPGVCPRPAKAKAKGKPEHAGKPQTAPAPAKPKADEHAKTAKPADKGGKPDDKGKPEDKGKPDDKGKPESGGHGKGK